LVVPAGLLRPALLLPRPHVLPAGLLRADAYAAGAAGGHRRGLRRPGLRTEDDHRRAGNDRPLGELRPGAAYGHVPGWAVRLRPDGPRHDVRRDVFPARHLPLLLPPARENG